MSDHSDALTAWDDYLAATQRLDAVRRQASSAASEQAGAMRSAREELARVRHRLALQQARFADVVARHRVPPPPLSPSDAEVNAALAPASGPAAVLASLRHARSHLDHADADLAGVDLPGGGRSGGVAGRSPVVRNLAVYGAFAIIALVLQAVLFLVASERSLPLFAPLCGVVLPVVAYGLGWLTVGLVFPGPTGGSPDRTPLLGALVCLVAPAVVTCAGIGMLTLLR